MKWNKFLLLVSFIISILFNDLFTQVINSQGQSLVGKQIEMTYSIGEIFIGTNYINDLYILSGFMDTEFLFSSIHSSIDSIDIKIFPQPFSHSLNISFDFSTFSLLYISVYDIIGTLFFSTSVSEHSNLISFENLPSKIYILKIFDSNYNFLKSFIVIKQR